MENIANSISEQFENIKSLKNHIQNLNSDILDLRNKIQDTQKFTDNITDQAKSGETALNN